MTHHQIKLIKSSWAIVGTIEPVTIGLLFYNRLFEIAPEVKSLFSDDLKRQSQRLVAMLSYIINKLDGLDDIAAEIVKLSHRHVSYGVKEEHYIAVGDALLWTLEQGMGGHWNKELREAWYDCYVVLSSAMINASDGYSTQNAA